MMEVLSTELRRQLERTVVDARDVAEEGARAALEALAVDRRDPFEHMSGEQRALRRRLRAHARHLGDKVDGRSGEHGINHLTHECAYEHWHAMLFARFLAESNLLIEPDFVVPVTLDECEELAKGKGTDRWTLASRFAQGMLPQVFRPDHPVFGVPFAREHGARLEHLVEGLAVEIFTASDALGWVYQFWQAKKKDDINRSEAKIGADELPAVTQLFTEPYMVQFLLHNSLGAWWASRHPEKACPADLTYLRHAENGRPEAGAFEGWPDDLSEFRLIDPCCGSGHFLVAAMLMLVPMRMALEGLDASTAVDSVLQENLHGLEIDQRCVAIAAFALALEAWRYPGSGGHRTLPQPNLAWCGQPVAGTKTEWQNLAEGDSIIEAGMSALHDAFRDAPTLGSLIDPMRAAPKDMLTAGFGKLRPLVERALEQEGVVDADYEEMAIAAMGAAEAAQLLTQQFHLVATNVPYLGRGKQAERLQRFCKTRYDQAKADLANVFVERCLEFATNGGVVQVVAPQNWLFLSSYKAQRQRLLKENSWRLLARLGPRAFDTISGEVVSVVLLTLSCARPVVRDAIRCIDAGQAGSGSAKALMLRTGALVKVGQLRQLDNPDARIVTADMGDLPLLSEYADGVHGFGSKDAPCFYRQFWEVLRHEPDWHLLQAAADTTLPWEGCRQIVYWQGGKGLLAARGRRGEAIPAGGSVWGKSGIVVSQMGELPASLYTGEIFDKSAAVVHPQASHVPALWCFCSSPEYNEAVRQLDQKMYVTNSTLVKIAYNADHWNQVAEKRYPNGLPQPYSDDPTQWIFHGHPCGSVAWDDEAKQTVEGPARMGRSVLHIAVARLLGYRWPTERDPEMELAQEQRAWVVRCATLHRLEDQDGIVCIPPVRGESPADERLLNLIRESYAREWTEDITARLLNGETGLTLEDWLRNRFFDEHCKLFHHRPFIWHVWDGRKRDGFHALVNYHRLAEGGGAGRQLLELLAYSYLGDWITRQRDGVVRGEAGSDGRLEAALQLQKRLAAIIEGEPPFDLFVRWKPLAEQAVGWNPDLNDGVRLNIRPFLADDMPGGKKGAGILRSKPNVHWRKDRGKEPLRNESEFPWFWADGHFTGERVNDWHFSNAEKRAVRGEAQ